MTEPIVSLKQGKLRGAVEISVLGPSYLAFKGIPYAAAPVGELRFKDPEPPTSWSNIRDASQNCGDLSAQMNKVHPFDIIGGEDCLYLNVYTDSLTGSKPVMFWVHGGGFVTGTGNDVKTRPDYLVTRDIVLVSPNYRLGALGFLNLDHEVAPGNQGLKDLIAALNWVKENIASFGGDPNNVTIFGLSAGGALVHALVLSPSTKGLINKAIIQGGTMTASWALGQSRAENGFKLASLLGKDSTDPKEVVEFLRTIPVQKIIKAQSEILTPLEKQTLRLAFGVNIDDKSENPVFPFPIEQLLANDVEIPYIIGHTSHEFLMFLEDKSDKAIQHIIDIMPLHLENIKGTKCPNEMAKLLKRFRDWYFGETLNDQNKIPGVVAFLSDIYFVIPTNRVVDERRKRGTAPTYFYKYSYVGKEKTSTDLIMSERLMTGAAHADEAAYLFYMPACKIDNLEPPAIGTKDRTTLERLTRMWTNFAKTGNPTPCLDDWIDTYWKPVTNCEFSVLEIGEDLKLLSVQPDVLSSEPTVL